MGGGGAQAGKHQAGIGRRVCRCSSSAAILDPLLGCQLLQQVSTEPPVNAVFQGTFPRPVLSSHFERHVNQPVSCLLPWSSAFLRITCIAPKPSYVHEPDQSLPRRFSKINLRDMYMPVSCLSTMSKVFQENPGASNLSFLSTRRQVHFPSSYLLLRSSASCR